MSIDLADEFNGLTLPDVRLETRAQKLLTTLAVRPSVGAPTVLSDAELEGFYRFVNNDRVSFEALLAAHVAATLGRSGNRDRVVIAHDTTDFRFADEVEREGLGPMDNGGQGFYAHFSLAVAGRGQALGVVGVEAWTRASRTSAKRTQKARYESPDKESLRWMRGVHAAECLVEGRSRLIHVMDREADDFDILCELVERGHSFVIRASFDRRLATDSRLKTFARELEIRCERDAQLSSRRKKGPAKQRKLYPPRDVRVAKLAFAAEPTTLRRPDRSRAPREELAINVVRVFEPAPPPGAEPVEWILLTSEPIETPDQVFQIVDDYRGRWVVEEYFKALKTGCAFEKRQNETKKALLNVLGIFIPIAWSLLNMRTISRDEQEAARPAEDAFTPTQLEIIRLEAKGRLSAKPTIGEALVLMARLFGGFQPSNGMPGWHILGRALERLLMIEAGWRLALAHLKRTAERSDR